MRVSRSDSNNKEKSFILYSYGFEGISRIMVILISDYSKIAAAAPLLNI